MAKSFMDRIPRWGRIEIPLTCDAPAENPCQEIRLIASFISPSGVARQIDGYWDGGARWCLRFSPDEEGEWQYTACFVWPTAYHSESIRGRFYCGAPQADTLFNRHGPVQLAANKRHLEHVDGTPYFWLADTAWNGPLRSTDDEWDHYLAARVQQRFTAVQWVATQWRTAPDGDIEGNLAFRGKERIAINPPFFQRLDRRLAAIVDAGLLPAPVMLWTVGAGENPEIDPGFGLPEDQAILLARYMVARWGAYPLLWILPGDGNYTSERAARWRRIGRAVFGDRPHAPVALHCCGQHFPDKEFRDEAWVDLLGYQSGHGDSDETWRWIVDGPPARHWNREPRLFQLNLEPAYENHLAYHSRQPHDAASVRRAIYWSLLNGPTAGVTYGGHGVWGWDDGSGPPVAHANTGTPLPWQDALHMDTANQMAYLVEFFTAIAWWRLRPDPSLLAEQPGDTNVRTHVLVSRSQAGDLAVAYTPAGAAVSLRRQVLQAGVAANWCNPRTGECSAAEATGDAVTVRFAAPDHQDWLLLLRI